MASPSARRAIHLSLIFLAFFFSRSSRAEEVLERISVAQLSASLDTPGVEILDLRVDVGEGLDRGEAAAIYRAGHIPGALPFRVDTLLAIPEPNERAKATTEALARTGPRAGHPISNGAQLVVYGADENDPRVQLAASQLRLAGRTVLVLEGGLKAWIETKEAPIVEVVDASELARRLEEANPDLKTDLHSPHLPVFDLRPKDAARRRRLPGAAILDGDQIDLALPEALAIHWPDFNRIKDPIAFYCYGRNCIRSRDAGMAAARLGYRHILWFRDGMPGWEEAGLPVFGDEVTAAAPGSSTAPLKPAALDE